MEECKTKECGYKQQRSIWICTAIESQKISGFKLDKPLKRLANVIRILGAEGRLDNVGFCDYTWQAAFLSDVHDTLHPDFCVNVVKGICEKGHCCLNVKCSLNKTTPESFARSLGFPWLMRVTLFRRNWCKLIDNLALLQPVAGVCKRGCAENRSITVIGFI